MGLQQEGNFWIASQGLKIFIKPVFEKVKREGVNELVEMFLPQRVTISDYGTSLFITNRQKDAGVVLAAIKTKNALHLMNVISFYDLAQLLSLKENSRMSLDDITVLLQPLATLDISRIISVLINIASQ